MPAQARQGDATDHGGTITTGSPTVQVNGQPAARKGDTHVCPIHGTNEIVSGSASVQIDGQPAARVGDVTACGATIIEGSENVMTG